MWQSDLLIRTESKRQSSLKLQSVGHAKGAKNVSIIPFSQKEPVFSSLENFRVFANKDQIVAVQIAAVNCNCSTLPILRRCIFLVESLLSPGKTKIVLSAIIAEPS